MSRFTSMLSKSLPMLIPALVAGAIATGAPSEADAQVRVVISVAPPPAYIATVEPEYFEGRPVYYYNNSWYYRDHGRWSYYRTEPTYLHERRNHWREHRVHEHMVREPPRYRYRR